MTSFRSDRNEVPARGTEVVGKTFVELLSNKVQAISLNRNDSALSSQASRYNIKPSFLNLLEGISPHEQAVLLDKCTVLELSSLAVVSRSIRKGVMSTMAKRSLIVRFAFHTRFVGYECERILVMCIDDLFDQSRNVNIEIGICERKENACLHWPKIQKLLYFCGHAIVKRIEFDYQPPSHASDIPSHFAMKSDHSSTSECVFDEFCVEEFVSNSCECLELLNFVSPRILKLQINMDDLDKSPSKLNAIFMSRGMRKAESIIVNSPTTGEVISDEHMLKLCASSITFHTTAYCIRYVDVKFLIWTPLGVAQFIEQWLRRRRVIKRVQSHLSMPDKPNSTYSPDVKFGLDLFHALRNLNQPPWIGSSTTLDDDLKGQLQILDGKRIYDPSDFGYYPTAATIRVTAYDGRKLKIVLSRAWNVKYNTGTEVGFIDIFPSNW